MLHNTDLRFDDSSLDGEGTFPLFLGKAAP